MSMFLILANESQKGPPSLTSNGPPHRARRGTNGRRRDPTGRASQLVLGLAALLLAALFLAGPAGPSIGAEPKSESLVSLTIDYGDGFQKCYPRVPWVSKMTVLDALRHAERHARPIKATFRGSASTALLTQIDDLQNEGNGRNWIYRVNDKLGDRSFAICPVQAGDQILWRFEAFAGE